MVFDKNEQLTAEKEFKKDIKEEAEELFKKKPLGYEMNPELEIYTDGFKDGYNKAKEKMQKLALNSLAEAMETWK